MDGPVAVLCWLVDGKHSRVSERNERWWGKNKRATRRYVEAAVWGSERTDEC